MSIFRSSRCDHQMANRSSIRPARGVIATAAGLALAASSGVLATPIEHSFTFEDVNWTSGGVGGIGDAGSGTIAISGIDGEVERAFLYWHGIVHPSEGTYDNPDISFEGNPVTGTMLGEGSTNCWGEGVSRAYRADVTEFVSGDGDFSFTGLADGEDYDVNGASLIVVYAGADTDARSDLVLFDGNDSSDPEDFAGQEPGWNAILEPINYDGGPALAEFHAADGQDFSSGPVEFSTPDGSLVIDDAPDLWSGSSTPTEGNSRATNGELWDIHLFDITDAFGGQTGPVALELQGMEGANDCKALIALTLDLASGSAPPPPGDPDPDPEPPETEAISVPVNSPFGLAGLSLMLMLAGLIAVRRIG